MNYNVCIESNGNATPKMSLSEYGNASQLIYEFRLFEMAIGPAYEKMAWVFMTLGLVGQTLCMIILKHGVSTQTPHFHFYKLMTAAELIYCTNFFISQALAQISTPHDRAKFNDFLHVWAAGYCCCLARFVYSSMGYIVLYMAIVITLDRFAAVWCRKWYRQINYMLQKELNVKKVCILAVMLSTILHSWSALVDHTVGQKKVGQKTTFFCQPRTTPAFFSSLKNIKNLYNMALRLCYPPVLLVLTIGVIWGFMRYQKQRETLLGRNVSFYTKRRHKERRRETNLFYLMFAVVILAFIQVLPVEIKRYLVFVHGSIRRLRVNAHLVKTCVVSFTNATRTVQFLYVMQWAQLIANLATQADRSLKFYLYLILNQHFRNEARRVMGAPFGIRGAQQQKSLRKAFKVEIQNSTVGAVHIATVPISRASDYQSKSGLELITVADMSDKGGDPVSVV